MNRSMLVQGILLTAAFVGQIIVTIFTYASAPYDWLQNIGWLILYLSALFGWWPIFTLRRWGQVTEGRGYIHTQTVVDRGPYAIVRHPQYLSGILLAIGVALLSQHGIAALLGLIGAGMTVAGIRHEEAGNVEKFGEAYLAYAERVPQLNMFAGIYRLIKRRMNR